MEKETKDATFHSVIMQQLRFKTSWKKVERVDEEIPKRTFLCFL